MKKRILRNHKLINVLVEHSKIDPVTVGRYHNICTLSPKFTPDDVAPLCDTVGQWPVPRKAQGKNFIIFDRYPEEPKEA